MKLEITQSMIGMFEKCGRQFQFRYLENIISPPSAALTVGSSIDDGVTLNLAQKISSNTDLPESDVVDATATSFDKRQKETDWQDDDPGKQKDLAVALVRAHHKEMAPLISPEKVQHKMQLDMGEYFLGGTADIIEKSGTIVDTKSSKDQYKPDAVVMKLQPAMYSLLSGSTRFRYDVLVKPTKTIGVRTQRIEGVVPTSQRTLAIRRAETVKRAVETGSFHYASEQGYWCSSKWCGYWNLCERGGKR